MLELNQAVEVLDKGGFSTARVSNDTDVVAIVDRDVDTVERNGREGRFGRIDVAEVFYFD